MTYTLPADTSIGHIHLKVADIDRALAFYRYLLGFTITQRYGSQAVFLAAGNYHHHIGLNTWQSKNAPPAPIFSAGLYHHAILYSTRKKLAAAYHQLLLAGYPITGMANHGVSEAIYVNDPDGNGVELYWDKPRGNWPVDDNGDLQMITERLDADDLLKALEQPGE